MNLLSKSNNHPAHVSVASEAKIKSIAVQNKWGANRTNKPENFLDNYAFFICALAKSVMGGRIS
ncbi:hypothetical protein H7F33_14550 [Pedobacter sp. PAMC26386]|nr:hypothetical protein H7F33_14550 [Pedobacter sp. PAMC26386]